MPEKATIERAARDKRQGKAPSTQAGEFVREEIHHIRAGKHGARSTKQAIAIGLAKARRAGVKLKTQNGGRGETKSTRKRSPRRSRASETALEHEPRRAASKQALSRHAKTSARTRTASARSAAAKKAARTRKRHKYL